MLPPSQAYLQDYEMNSRVASVEEGGCLEVAHAPLLACVQSSVKRLLKEMVHRKTERSSNKSNHKRHRKPDMVGSCGDGDGGSWLVECARVFGLPQILP